MIPIALFNMPERGGRPTYNRSAVRGWVHADSRDDIEAPPSPVICLRMARTQGLVLKPAVTKKYTWDHGDDYEYRRVGYLRTDSDEGDWLDDCSEITVTIVWESRSADYVSI